MGEIPRNLMEDWLATVRSRFVVYAPDLLPLFDTYAGEARFGRHYINTDIEKLSPGTKLLEVGAGAMLVSCQLVLEGFEVCALEPIGTGFSHFDRMRNLVLETAQSIGGLPEIVNQSAESLNAHEQFAYAFSINVMEHVADVGVTLQRVHASLINGGTYHFICPNYLFPYEPHFNMPTVFHKGLTGILFHRRIISYKNFPDPLGVWNSLNWINVLKVIRLARRMDNAQISFNRKISAKLFSRIMTDEDFAKRHSGMVKHLSLAFANVRAYQLLEFIPVFMQPLMDCYIKKQK